MIKSKIDSTNGKQMFNEMHLGRLKVTSLLLIIFFALPHVSASENAGSYTLNIYGNANMDENIDDADVSYVQEIISGNSKPTELADANHDGKVDALDIDQAKRIIEGDAKNLTIIDAQNRSVTLQIPIENVISVNTGAIEIMRDIGVDINEVFIGVSSYALEDDLYWPELKGKESIKYGSPDYEKIAKLKPDLVILYKTPSKEESIEKFDAIDVPVICLDCFNLEGLDGSTKMLGELFNKREKANELIQWYRGYIDLVKDRTEGLSAENKPKALFYNFPDINYPVVKVSTSKASQHLLIVEAGGKNLAADLNSSTGSAAVDREWILTQNPDVIIGSLAASKGKCGYSADPDKAFGYMHKVHDMLVVDQAIRKTNAANERNIYIIDTDLNRGPMWAAGIAYTAKILHPELFKDLDPEAILKEYFDKWQGIPYKGIYIYPPLE